MTLDEVKAAVDRGDLVAGQPALQAMGTAILRTALDARTSPAMARALVRLGQS